MPCPKKRAQSERATPVPSPVFAHQAVLGHQDLAASVRQQQRVTDALVQRTQRLQAHLPGDWLHHAIGCKLRPDDRNEGWRRPLLDEGRAQEPVVRVAAVEATLEQTIVKRTRAQLRVVERKGI